MEYEDKYCEKLVEPLAREKLGDLEIKEFKEIEGWLFDCSSGK